MFHVKNYGPDSATDVILVTTVEKTLYDPAASDSRCTFYKTYNVGNVECNLGTLDAGEETEVILKFKTNHKQCPFEMQQRAYVRWGNPFDDHTSAGATSVGEVECPASQKVNLSPQVTYPTSMDEGETEVFKYSIDNNSDALADSVKMTIDVSSGLEFVPSGSSANCTLKNGDVVCETPFIMGQSYTEAHVQFRATSCNYSPVETVMTYTTSTAMLGSATSVDSSTNVYCAD
jgi:hypothetical protein